MMNANVVPDESGELSRQALDERLRFPQRDSSTHLSPWSLFHELDGSSRSAGFHFNWKAALVHWSNLVRCGAVATLGDNHQSGGVYPRRPLYVVTDHGRKMLERGAESPHDETRYIAALRKRVAAPDEIALSYVRESAGAWRAGLYRASAVMLGCACERLALLLAEHVRTNDLAPYSKNLEIMTKPGKVPSITDVFTQVRGGIVAAAEDKRLPGDLAPDIIDRRLSSVFEHVRVLRNASGHPTGEDVSAEEAEAGLLLFPAFHELVSRILTDLKPKGERHG